MMGNRAKIRILHLVYSGQGGLGSYLMNFVRSDYNGLFLHHVVFYGVEPLFPEYQAFCQGNNIPFIYIKRKDKIDLASLVEVLKFAKKYGIQFMLLHTFSLSLLTIICLFTKYKIIAFEHTSNAFKTYFEKISSLLNHIFAYKMIYFYKGHFDGMKRVFPVLRFGANSHLLPKNVDINFFKPLTSPVQNNFFTIGMASRLIKGKRHELIIESIHNLLEQDIRINFKIAGKGPEEQNLKRQVERLGLGSSVSFLGALSQAEIVSFYQSLDAYIHASDGETVCYSIMEAQACGVPILASNVEGIVHFLKLDTGGILFENESSQISKAIMRLFNDDNKKKIALKARKHAELLSAENNNADKVYYFIQAGQ